MTAQTVLAQKEQSRFPSPGSRADRVPLLKKNLEKNASAFFSSYEDRALEKEVMEGIQRLSPQDTVSQMMQIHNLILPVVDSCSSPGWTEEKRGALLRFYNLLVESDWVHDSHEPPLGEIANYSRVSSRLHRGGQPTGEGFRWLVNHGVKTVVSLRGEDPLDLDVMKWSKVKRLKISVKDGDFPTLPQVEEFIRTVDDPESGPVYVHCRGGVGRTGIMVACWRVSHGWTAGQAINEARTFATTGKLPDNQEQFIKEFEGHWKATHCSPGAAA